VLHLRLTPIGNTPGGSASKWLAQIGPTGSWGDLSFSTRWGDGASGMFEASWTMALPPGFEGPLLRRGTLVEIFDGPWRIGSPLILSEPAVGAGLDEPWSFNATGIGREVEGDNSFFCFRTSDGETTTVPSEAVDYAIANGWRIAGRDSNVPTGAIGGTATTDELMTVGSLLNEVNKVYTTRWAVNGENVLKFYADPTSPTYQISPGAVALGTADDDFASVVKFRYIDSTTGKATTVTSTNTNVAARFGNRTYGVNRVNMPAMSAATAQGYADAILALSKGRLAWTNGLTVTPNEILTMGGRPADLSKVAEDVGNGCMVRLHGIWSDLLEYNGQTWLDIVIGEAKYTDGAQTIQLNPIGLAARDLASFAEAVTGYKDES
jgi:hypothetical protein